MSTRELAQRMAANSGVTPLLIDVRTHEEYEVSHLPGAIWAETPSQIAVLSLMHRGRQRLLRLAENEQKRM